MKRQDAVRGWRGFSRNALAAGLAACALGAAAWGQEIRFTRIPDGYEADSIPLGMPAGGALAADPNDPEIVYMAVGPIGAYSLARIDLRDKSLSIVAQGPFSGLNGIAVFPDGSIAMTENGALETILLARDGNADGDFDDDGEIGELIAPILTNPNNDFTGAQIRLAPAGDPNGIPSGSLVLQTADGGTASELLVIENPLSAPAFRPEGGAFYSGFAYNGGFDFDSAGRIYMGALSEFFAPEIHALVNLNGDEGIGPGESRVLPGTDLTGVLDLAIDAEDDVFCTDSWTGGVKTFRSPADPLADSPAVSEFCMTDSVFHSMTINTKARPFEPYSGPGGAAMLIAGTMGDGSWASGRNLLALRPAAPPDIAAEPVALDFGERDIDDGPSPALAILAVNQGLGALRFGVPAFAIVGPDAASFAIVGSPAADPLAPGESVAVAIAFDPARTGLHEASLAIATNDPDSPVLSVPLSGGGIQTPGAASLGDLSGNGEGEMQLRWANPNTAPLAFFAMAYDVYEEEFVSFDGFGSALPVAPDATSATLPLAFTGAYHAWIGSYYPDGAWFVSDPMTAILYGGLPHAPRRVQVEPVLGQGQVRLRWKTDLYGVWHYQIVCYKHSEGFVAVDGPSAALGIEPWTFVDYGGLAFDAARASFIEGWADFRLPGPGVYTFFIRGVSWMDPHWGGAYGTATAFVLP